MLYSNENHISFDFVNSRSLAPVRNALSQCFCCTEGEPSSHHSDRRYSSPESNELSSELQLTSILKEPRRTNLEYDRNITRLPPAPNLTQPSRLQDHYHEPSADHLQYRNTEIYEECCKSRYSRLPTNKDLPRVEHSHTVSEVTYTDSPQRQLNASSYDQPDFQLREETTDDYESTCRDHDSKINLIEIRQRNILRYYKRSARSFLELTPDFDEEFQQTEFPDLPPDYFRRSSYEQYFQPQVEQPTLLAYHQHTQKLGCRRKLTWDLLPPRSSFGRSQGISQGRMNQQEDHQRKIIIEFCHLLEKSKQLFNGLRELPQYGHKQWHSYFGRTFDIYTKLWKFQQQHRAILDTKYGLKRWQIGEIASKIGQLYYHFYLRTSEAAYLAEAFSFYSAIRGRTYYTQASKADKCELLVKKLRYYARFIVTGLLLKKIKLVKDLLKELDEQITDYGNTYDPDDQVEWRIVADEIREFIKSEPVVTVHTDSCPVILSHRLSPETTPPVERSPHMTFSLQEVLIIGNNSVQVKFSELTMDMFRMLQTLEREPSGDIQHMYDESPQQQFVSAPSAVINEGYDLESGPNRGANPHKFMLFKPSPSQIFVFLASGCDDLPPNGVILLYISADGQIVSQSKHPDNGGYDVGGLITTSKTDVMHRETIKDGKPLSAKHKEAQILHPGDLYPFTRRPMFLIIDSENSYIFQNMPRHFGQPLVILMSPQDTPASMHTSTLDKRADGSLFTLFLHCPLSALCYCCDIHNMTLNNWERAQTYIDNYLAEASLILTRSRADMMYIAFMGDDFLRLLILRFILCETILRMHRAFRGRTHLTRASPPLPEELYGHPALTRIVMDLAHHIQVRNHFQEQSGTAPSTSKE